MRDLRLEETGGCTGPKGKKGYRGRQMRFARVRSLGLLKLKSQRGDSIAEVLVSLLISVFAITMLATMISTAMTLVKRSNDVTNSYLEAGNDLISPPEDDSSLKAVKETGTVTMRVKGLAETSETNGAQMRMNVSDNDASILVYYYTNSTLSGNNVTAYHIKE